jgi:crotonobetainyl-CoA:carnitine CoA-transferase CaiB-like acyl-CoA transferase
VEEQHALAGVRVLDLTGSVAGAVAGMLLADLGADVVKVHPPESGPRVSRPGLVMWDRGKRAATADPSSAEDLLVLDQLIATADVLLVGTSGPGITYRGLIDRGRRPGKPCFWVVMPPYLLEETPWPGDQESAGLLSAWLGHAWNQSSYADAPVDYLFPLALHMQGIWGAIVAVALLLGRQRGRTLAPLAVAGGAHGTQLVSPGIFAASRDEPHVQRPGGPGGALPNYRTYRCGDGRWLFLGAFTNAFIERGLTAAGAGWIFADPRVGGNPGNLRLPENMSWIARELEKVFATRSRDEWLDLLEAADCPAAPVNEPGTWLDHDQVKALGLRLEAVSDTGQEIVLPGPLINLSLTPPSVRGPAASSWPEIARLRPLWSEAGPPEQRQPGRPPSAAPGESAPQPPLSGLRVLDLGTIIAGPYVGSLLADLGADVIKIERPPLGDEFRVAHGGRGGSSFEVYNRDQRSALLDLSPGEDRLLFDRLAGSADVVVDNYRTGVASRLGITHDQLAAVNPEVVTVSISAFGDTGPLGRRPGFDPIIQAMSGIMRAQGGPDPADSPAFLTVPVNDVLAAGLAALGACAALLARARLGRGQHVGVTLCAASCLLQSGFLAQSNGSGAYPAGGRDFAGPGPLDRLYQAADGWVRLAAAPGQLPALTAAGLAPAPGQVEPGDEALAAGISVLVAGLPAAEVIARAHAAGIPAVRARQPRELTADAQLIRHGLLTVLDRDDHGVTRVDPGRWLEMPGLPAREPGQAPAAGEHTETLRRGHAWLKKPSSVRPSCVVRMVASAGTIKNARLESRSMSPPRPRMRPETKSMMRVASALLMSSRLMITGISWR